MELTNQDAERIARAGVQALQAGRPAEARQYFETITQSGRANAQIWLLLAVACRADADDVAEEEALDRLIALEPRTVRGLIMKGD
ncbi:MAG: hypothetical protein C0520_07345, partial [Sphingopyxis sp.]|nr:hypothetical protein [Sphingopyxis sp.]